MPDPVASIRPLRATMRPTAQDTRVTGAETVTDTRWAKDTLGGDAFVATNQQTRLDNYDTRTKTSWATGTVTVDGGPVLDFQQDAPAVAYGEQLKGLAVRLDGARPVASSTRLSLTRGAVTVTAPAQVSTSRG